MNERTLELRPRAVEAAYFIKSQNSRGLGRRAANNEPPAALSLSN